MNRLTIIGNLTRDPEQRTTPSGANVCSFTVAVNRRGRRDAQGNQPEADFFRVSAWNQLRENCARYLAKGRKVAVVGSVSVHTYTGNDGQTRASLEVMANDVEFLSSRSEADSEGVAFGYVELCRRLGLDCRIVYGQKDWQDHCWNIVRIDGEYYHVDLFAGMDNGFLKNDSAFWGSYRWAVNEYPKCNGSNEI